MVVNLAMCPPRRASGGLIATKGRETATLANKTKRRKRREPGEPFRRIRLKREHAFFRADHDIRALRPIFNQWQNMGVFASINRCKNDLFLWGRFYGDIRGRFYGDIRGRFYGDIRGRFYGDIRGRFYGELDPADTPLPLFWDVFGEQGQLM